MSQTSFCLLYNIQINVRPIDNEVQVLLQIQTINDLLPCLLLSCLLAVSAITGVLSGASERSSPNRPKHAHAIIAPGKLKKETVQD